MAETSPRLGWPYPSKEEDPWFETFVDMVNAMDQSAYASRSDRHIILAEGGTVSWSTGTDTLEWTDTILLTAPITGFVWQILASTATLDTNGQVLYVTLNRGPGSNTALSVTVANTVPSTNDTLVIAARLNDRIYFRNGTKLDSGDSITTLGGGAGGGGTSTEYRDEGGTVVTDPSVVDFVGDGVTATDVSGNLQVEVPATEYRDEGSALTKGPSSVDFTGDGVTASESGGAVTVNIPGGASDMRTAKIIVGNSANGDVAANADYLDSGNGEQLESALAAASAGDDIYIRPGTYDLGAGSASAPLSVPAGVRVWGGGKEQVTIVTKSSGDMGALSLGNGAEIWNIGIQVAVPTGSGSGSTALVTMSTRSKSGNIKVDWQGSSYTLTEGGNLVMRQGFAVLDGTSDVRVVDVELLDLPSLRDLTIADDMIGFISRDGTLNARHSEIVRPIVENGDVAIFVKNKAHVVDPSVSDAFRRGVVFDATLGGNVVMRGGTLLNSGPDASYRGIEAVNGIGKVTIDGVDVIGPTTPIAGSEGILLSGDRCSVRGCNVEGYDVGLDADGTSVRNVAIANILSDNNTPISDTGTNNDLAHNITA